MKKLLIVLFVAISANFVSAQETAKTTTTKTEMKKDCKKDGHCCSKKSAKCTKVESKTTVKKG
jgi:Mg2+/Co2+ transporter CorB